MPLFSYSSPDLGLPTSAAGFTSPVRVVFKVPAAGFSAHTSYLLYFIFTHGCESSFAWHKNPPSLGWLFHTNAGG
jgi:hypothetical protein